MSNYPPLSVRVVNPDGTYGSVLPDQVGIDLTLTDGDANAVVITYRARSATSELLVDNRVIVVLVGGVEYDEMRFVLDDTGRDEVLADDDIQWSALSLLGRLDHALVLPDYLGGTFTDGHSVGAVAPGKGFRELLELAQARNAATWCDLDFTDGADSSGATWSAMTGSLIEQGTTLRGVLTNWHERKVATATIGKNGKLRLFKYGNQGIDRSQTARGILTRGRDFEDGPYNRTTRDARSVMWARGDIPITAPASGADAAEGVEDATTIPILVKETNQSALDTWGVREAWLSQQQVDDETQLRSIASASLALTNRARDGYSYKLTLAPDCWLPLLHWREGDIMQVRVVGASRTMRVRSITLQQERSGDVTGTAAFGDRYMDADERLQRRLDSMTSTSQDGGLFGSSTTIASRDDPNANVAVVHNEVDQAVWDKLVAMGYTIITSGSVMKLYAPKSVVQAVFDDLDITSNTEGTGIRDAVPPGPVTNLSAASFPIIGGPYLNTTTVRLTWTAPSDDDIAWYEIAYQDLTYQQNQNDTPPWWNSVEPVGADATGATITGLRPGEGYRFRVRTIDNWYNVSTWTYLDATAAIDQTPPNGVPSTPILAARLFNAIEATWDGKRADGTAFSYPPVTQVIVTVSPRSDGSGPDSRQIGRILVTGGQPASLLITDLAPGTDWYVKFTAITPWGVGTVGQYDSAVATLRSRDVFSAGVTDGSITPEMLAYRSDDNLILDGSFERADWRDDQTAAAGSFGVSPDGFAWTNGKPTGSGFTQPTGTDRSGVTNADVDTNTVVFASNSTHGTLNQTKSVVNGAWSKVGQYPAVWASAMFPFVADRMYRVEVTFKCQADGAQATGSSTSNDSYQACGVAVVGLNSAGNYLDYNNSTTNTYIPTPPAMYRVEQKTGEYTVVTYVKGTSATEPSVAQGGSFDGGPRPLPTASTGYCVHIWLDWGPSRANCTATMSVLSLRSFEVEQKAYDGTWVYEMGTYGQWQRFRMLADLPSKGEDQFYGMARVKLTGSRTNQPTCSLVASWVSKNGVVLATVVIASKSGGFNSDGWYMLDGRTAIQKGLGATNAWYRSGLVDHVEFHVSAYNIVDGQKLRWDAIEVRRVMTNVLIADASIDTAKVRELSVTKLTAGTLDADTVVGRSVKTAQVPGSASEVGLYSKYGQGKGYAHFSATDDAGLESVLINAEDGNATFTGTVKAAELTGYLRARSSIGYVEVTPSVSDFLTGIGPGVQFVPTAAAWARTPAIMKLGGSTITLVPSRLHIAGQSQTTLTNSYVQHSIGFQRTNNTAAADVDTVFGDFVVWHTYGNMHFTDTTSRGAVGRYPTLWLRGNSNGYAGIGIDREDSSNQLATWVDALRSSSPRGTSVLYCGMRADGFQTMSFSEGKRSIASFDLGDEVAGDHDDAVSFVLDHPSQVWQRAHGEDDAWYVGPMADGMPDWLTRGGGLAAHDLIGVLWRCVEEQAPQIAELKKLVKELTA